MSKVNGNAGDIFVCYKDNKTTYNIVTNGNEAANGGVDDGKYAYRQLTPEEMKNGDILDKMAQKNTLVDWQKYSDTTATSWNNPAKPPAPTPTPVSTNTPAPTPTPVPTNTPAPTPTPPTDPATNTPGKSLDPKNITSKDIDSIYRQDGNGSNSTTSFTHLVNEIKQKAGLEGSGQLYLKQSDIRRAADMESNPDKKAIFEWLHEKFHFIDHSKYGGWDYQGTQNFEDGLIGAGDLEKYFGKSA